MGRREMVLVICRRQSKVTELTDRWICQLCGQQGGNTVRDTSLAKGCPPRKRRKMVSQSDGGLLVMVMVMCNDLV